MKESNVNVSARGDFFSVNISISSPEKFIFIQFKTLTLVWQLSLGGLMFDM